MQSPSRKSVSTQQDIELATSSSAVAREVRTVNSFVYSNPVIPGFFPDPSIVRVGNDYYLVNSTFQYFPAIVISHSRDLVHWRQIGHVFNDPKVLDLQAFYDGCGVWAPDISYHDGWFYVFYCLVQLRKDRSVNVRGNYMVRAREITGPYTSPVQLTTDGNDPSHFVDDDGSHYLLYAAGQPLERGTKIVRLSDDCSRTIGEAQWMRWGSDRRAPEGPHLFKRNGFYYHTMAAGSGLFDGHHQLMARARSILGPYEQSPIDPFIVQRDPAHPMQNPGHAKLVESPRGDWWAVYLVQRKLDGFSPLGRETAIDRVDWTDDQWPIINQGRGPAEMGTMRGTPAFEDSSSEEFHDDFNSPHADTGWQFLRTFDPHCVSFVARPNHVRLIAGSFDLADAGCHSLMLRREISHHYIAETYMEFDPADGGFAGIVCYYDTACHIAFGLTHDNGDVLRLEIRDCGKRRVVAQLPAIRHRVHLRVSVAKLRRSFSYSWDGVAWRDAATLENASFLSDEATPEWGFTGTMVGLFAVRGTGEGFADFAHFTQRTMWLQSDRTS